MELMGLDVVADLLGRTPRTVKAMVKRGDLQAVYPKTGKNGRPNMMITVSSYGKYLLKKESEEKRHENKGRG